MLRPRFAAPVRDFAIELDGEMFAVDSKLSDGAGTKMNSAVKTGPDVGGPTPAVAIYRSTRTGIRGMALLIPEAATQFLQ
jgi:hypothetical protein